MPASSMVATWVWPLRRPSLYFFFITPQPPRNAHNDNRYGPNTSGNPPKNEPPTIAKAAPNAAPLDTPTNPESASGLRNNPCIATPDNANTPPTASPSKVRGKRICPRISSACSKPLASIGTPIRRKAALSVSSNGRLTGPSANESQIARTHNSVRPINSVRGLTSVLIGQAWPGTDRSRPTTAPGFAADAARARRPAAWGPTQTPAHV